MLAPVMFEVCQFQAEARRLVPFGSGIMLGTNKVSLLSYKSGKPYVPVAEVQGMFTYFCRYRGMHLGGLLQYTPQKARKGY